MANRVLKALKYFEGGSNCAQSVVMAYCGLFGVSAKKGCALSAGFGGGIAGTRGMCGTVSAMIILAGLRFAENKAELNGTIINMIKEFTDTAGTDNCKELLARIKDLSITFPSAEARNAVKKFSRPCAKLVILACEIIEKYLNV